MAADVALAQKLGEELKYEKEAAAPGEPEFLSAFKAQGVWRVRARSNCMRGHILTVAIAFILGSVSVSFDFDFGFHYESSTQPKPLAIFALPCLAPVLLLYFALFLDIDR